MSTKLSPNQASAELYRLAQAEAMLRLFHDEKGYRPSTIQELEDWVRTKAMGLLEPSKQDIEKVSRENPDLVAVITSSN